MWTSVRPSGGGSTSVSEAASGDDAGVAIMSASSDGSSSVASGAVPATVSAGASSAVAGSEVIATVSVDVASTCAKAGLTTISPTVSTLTMRMLNPANAITLSFMHSVYYPISNSLMDMGIA